MHQNSNPRSCTRSKNLWLYCALLLLSLLYGIFQFQVVFHPVFSTSLLSSYSSSSFQSKVSITDHSPKGRIFYCGWEWPIARLFPDFNDSQPHKQWNPNEIPPNSTEHDILVYGMHGPCPSRNVERILHHDFAGKVLYLNGESVGNVFDMIPQDWILDPKNHPQVYRLFQIGPYPPIQFQVGASDSNSNNTSDTNVLLKQQRNQFYNQQSLLVFHMAIYLSRELAEREDNNDSLDRTTRINHNQDRHNDIIQSNTPLWKLLSDHSKKPRNTREYSAIVYLASNCQPHRQIAAQQLSTVVPVHYGEICTVVGVNNSRIPSSLLTNRDDFRHNDLIFRHYKYCLVMENTQQEGYMSEKLLSAYLSGCLPIYYGTKEVFEIFHPNSFVFYDVYQPNASLELMRLLEANDTLYEEMLYSTPILLHGEETVDQFLSLDPKVANGQLNRKVREMMGIDELLLV
jgi:hypothetical protein